MFKCSLPSQALPSPPADSPTWIELSIRFIFSVGPKRIEYVKGAIPSGGSRSHCTSFSSVPESAVQSSHRANEKSTSRPRRLLVNLMRNERT
ncbi:hypothetical protein PFISCL1PPCAC_25393, partial [Pristionchus fissidentatus]